MADDLDPPVASEEPIGDDRTRPDPDRPNDLDRTEPEREREPEPDDAASRPESEPEPEPDDATSRPEQEGQAPGDATTTGRTATTRRADRELHSLGAFVYGTALCALGVAVVLAELDAVTFARSGSIAALLAGVVVLAAVALVPRPERRRRGRRRTEPGLRAGRRGEVAEDL